MDDTDNNETDESQVDGNETDSTTEDDSWDSLDYFDDLQDDYAGDADTHLDELDEGFGQEISDDNGDSGDTTEDANNKADADAASQQAIPGLSTDYFQDFINNSERAEEVAKMEEAAQEKADTLSQIAAANAASGNQLAYTGDDVRALTLAYADKMDEINAAKTAASADMASRGVTPTPEILNDMFKDQIREAEDIERREHEMAADIRAHGETSIPGISSAREQEIIDRANEDGISLAEAYTAVTGKSADAVSEGLSSLQSRVDSAERAADESRAEMTRAAGATTPAASSIPAVPSGPSLSTSSDTPSESTPSASSTEVDTDISSDPAAYAESIGGTYDPETGNVTVQNEDGSRDIYSEDGTHSTIGADGSTTTYDADGNVVSEQYDEGGVTTIVDHTTGETTTQDYNTGIMTVTHADGTTETYQATRDPDLEDMGIPGGWNFADSAPIDNPQDGNQNTGSEQDMQEAAQAMSTKTGFVNTVNRVIGKDTKLGQYLLEQYESGPDGMILGETITALFDQAFGNQVGNFVANAGDLKGAIEQSKTGIQQMKDAINNKDMNGFWKSVGSFLKGLGNLLTGAGRTIWNGVQMAGNVVMGLVHFLSNFTGFGALTNMFNAGQKRLGDFLDSIQKGLGVDENTARQIADSLGAEDASTERSAAVTKKVGWNSKNKSATNVSDYNKGLGEEESNVTSDFHKKVIKYLPHARLAVKKWRA